MEKSSRRGGPVPAPILTLTEGLIHTMYLSSVKRTLAALVAAGVLAAGVGTAPVRAEPDKPKPADPKVEKPAKPAPPAGEKPAKPAPDEPKKAQSVHGTVKAVDAGKGTITVAVPAKGGDTTDRTVSLAPDARVFVDGAEAKLADVKTGLPVNLKLTPDGKAAVGVGVEGPTLTGELKAMDPDKRTLRVAVVTHPDPKDKTKTATEEKTLTAADAVKVSLAGQKKATLADLKAGTSVVVRLSAEGGRVIAVASPAKPAGDGTKKPEKPTKPGKGDGEK